MRHGEMASKGRFLKKRHTPTCICRAHPKRALSPPFFVSQSAFFFAFPGASQQVEFKNTKKIEVENVYKKMRKAPFRFFFVVRSDRSDLQERNPG
jgi:hypothetical protein